MGDMMGDMMIDNNWGGGYLWCIWLYACSVDTPLRFATNLDLIKTIPNLNPPSSCYLVAARRRNVYCYRVMFQYKLMVYYHTKSHSIANLTKSVSFSQSRTQKSERTPLFSQTIVFNIKNHTRLKISGQKSMYFILSQKYTSEKQENSPHKLPKRTGIHSSRYYSIDNVLSGHKYARPISRTNTIVKTI